MKHLLASICFILISGAANAKNSIIDKSNPVVIATTPVAGTVNVNANLTEISVTFSHEMQTKNMWSVINIAQGHFPQVTGKVRYLDDNKTFVIPVKLEKNKEYVLGFNSINKQGFKSKSSKSALPYILVFKTAK